MHRVVERLDRSAFEEAYSEKGGALYAPELMLKVWLYAYALGITSARRLEQRIREDIGLRYLAGGQQPDNWALSAFRRRHGRALNEVFTQVVEMARELGLGRLGMLAIDSTGIRAQASRDGIDTEQRLRNERARLRRQIRRWQKACDASDPDEGAGTRVQVEGLELLASGDTAALSAVAQERRGEAVAPRWRGAISAGAGRFHAGVHGGDCGE